MAGTHRQAQRATQGCPIAMWRRPLGAVPRLRSSRQHPPPPTPGLGRLPEPAGIPALLLELDQGHAVDIEYDLGLRRLAGEKLGLPCRHGDSLLLLSVVDEEQELAACALAHRNLNTCRRREQCLHFRRSQRFPDELVVEAGLLHHTADVVGRAAAELVSGDGRERA